MFAKNDDVAAVRPGSDTTRSSRRRCVPHVAPLEDRSLLSTAGAHLAPFVVSPHGPMVADVHSGTTQLARAEHAASVARTIEAEHFRPVHFPGGFVAVNRRGTHVRFPGGSVNTNRFGTSVFFPGGFVITRFGHTIVSWPGGSITI
jgi:hypothetical protein